MSVGLTDQRNGILLLILVSVTIAIAAVGITWLRAGGYALIEEVTYLLLVLIGALFAGDRLLIK